MEAALLLSLANLFYLVGTLFLTRKVIKNRNALNDFDFYGSLINVAGMLITAYAFIMMEWYSAAIISLPTMVFWAIAAIYSFKNRRVKNEKKDICCGEL